MKLFIFMVSLFLCSLPSIYADKETNKERVFQSPHYEVTSFADPEDAQKTALIMEGLFNQYSSLLLIDPKNFTSRFKVYLYPDKKDFDAALVSILGKPSEDFVFVKFNNKDKTILYAWKDETKLSSWAFQGWLQFVWTFVPYPPAWLEVGMAYHFYDLRKDKDQLVFDQGKPLLDALHQKWDSAPGNLDKLIGSESLAPGDEPDAWALCVFLMKVQDASYNRALGAILADLSSGGNADLKTNTQKAKDRLLAVGSIDKISKACSDWWAGQLGFSSLMTAGLKSLKENHNREAQNNFEQAIVLKPLEGSAYYLAGLSAYNGQNPAKALEFYAQAANLWTTAPPGLLEYAQGCASFQLKDWTKARSWLDQSKKIEDYAVLSANLLDKLPEQ